MTSIWRSWQHLLGSNRFIHSHPSSPAICSMCALSWPGSFQSLQKSKFLASHNPWDGHWNWAQLHSVGSNSRTPCGECNIVTYCLTSAALYNLGANFHRPLHEWSFVWLPNQYHTENNTKFLLPTWNVAWPTWTKAVVSKCLCDLIRDSHFQARNPQVEALSFANPLLSNECSQTGIQLYSLKPSGSRSCL